MSVCTDDFQRTLNIELRKGSHFCQCCGHGMRRTQLAHNALFFAFCSGEGEGGCLQDDRNIYHLKGRAMIRIAIRSTQQLFFFKSWPSPDKAYFLANVETVLKFLGHSIGWVVDSFQAVKSSVANARRISVRPVHTIARQLQFAEVGLDKVEIYWTLLWKALQAAKNVFTRNLLWCEWTAQCSNRWLLIITCVWTIWYSECCSRWLFTLHVQQWFTRGAERGIKTRFMQKQIPNFGIWKKKKNSMELKGARPKTKRKKKKKRTETPLLLAKLSV